MMMMMIFTHIRVPILSKSKRGPFGEKLLGMKVGESNNMEYGSSFVLL
jgi:hypothetical protein